MENADVEIRGFKASDLDDLQEIRALAFAPVFRSFREIVGASIADVALASLEAEQAELLANACKAKSPEQVFVGELDGAIVGFVSISLDQKNKTGEIGLNAVHPDHAGQGIGTRLYEFALGEMKAAGMEVATVGVGGDPSHAAARRAYEKAGFGPAIPSLWMYRSL
ncbi:MAG: GNAT family N-acetyltransferase [Hyphomicrobiales bacterium]|nr:GNAT family N-acetyltransferase [Hyphomicrobiales bacterium]